MGLTLPLEAVRKDGDVYVLELEDIQVVFRLPPIKRAMQYSHLLSAAETPELQYIVFDYIFRDCIEDKFMATNQEIGAGLPETVARLVLMLSGVDDNYYEYTNLLLDTNRKSVDVVLNTMKRTICGVFSSYRFSDLDALNYQELVYVFVQAEKCMLDLGTIEQGLVIKDPKAVEEKPVSIGQMIRQDTSEYNQFDPSPAVPNPDEQQRQAMLDHYRKKRRGG
jgi:hypothetical protein